MTAWYEFEEWVGRLWHRWASSAVSFPRFPDAAVDLDTVREPLAVYFRALGGEGSIALGGALARGSGHRLSFRQRLGMEQESLELARRTEENLILPARLDLFPADVLNRDLYFWLAAFLAEARPVIDRTDPLERDLRLIAEAVRTTRALVAELPGLAARHRRLCRASLQVRPRRRLPPMEAAVEALIRHLLGADGALPDAARQLLDVVTGNALAPPLPAPPDYRPPLPVPLWGEAAPAVVAAPRPEESDPQPGPVTETGDTRQRPAERRRLDQTERDDPLLLNPFEKLLSWSEMVNVNRPVEDDEEAHARQAAEQLEKLTLSKHKRPSATRLRMELELPPDAVEASPIAGPLLYPEWDYRRRAYRPDNCAVHLEPVEAEGGDSPAPWRPNPATRRRIRRIRRQFEALRPRRQLMRRQLDGDAIDLDALVRSTADTAAGGHGGDGVYMQWREQARDLAVATLVDVSLSTDSWVDDRRVLEIEQEALLVLAHGIQACGDQHAIYTFTSRRRKFVKVRCIKGFGERVDERIERRIGALQPGLYTRMGAAIRHVTSELAVRANRHRLLLVLTDGKPNDTDHYEGRFAVEDTAMAVREARRQGLAVFGVTIDVEARQYFPAIFGRSGYAIVFRAAGLSGALPLLYRQLVR
jgi:nitric oxide reductase NorD protein